MQRPRGTQDLMGDQILKFRHIEATAYQLAQQFAFQEIATPIFEQHDVFHRTLGDSSDMVAKETYDFQDRGGETLTLRPEGTAPIARAFLSEGLQQNLPLKFYYYGPMFRYERPQRGRFRQFHQIGVEHLGTPFPESDAEVILLAWEFLSALGLTDKARVELNSLGDAESRANYRTALVSYFEAHKSNLCADSLVRLEKNPLRILDSKDRGEQDLIRNAPKLAKFLNDDSRKFFDRVCEQLTKLNLPFQISDRLVRGIDYYCHTVFEITTAELGAQGTLLGGGRYDGLIELMGGPKTPSVGWAAGVERLADLLGDKAGTKKLLKVGILTADEIGEVGALALRSELLQSGCEINLLFGSMGVGKKFKKADKLGLQWVIILGEKEIQSQVLTLKNLSTGLQSEIPRAKVSQFLFKEKNGEPAPRADS